MFWFRREPAFWLNGFAVAVMWLSTWFLHLTIDQQAVLNAVAVAVAGVIIAFSTHDGQVAALAGLTKAVIALGLGFGLHLDDARQATLLALVTFISTMFIRAQVTAPAPPRALFAPPPAP